MADSVLVKFASGNLVRFGNGGDELREVALLDDFVEKTEVEFHKALGGLADVVKALEAAVGKLETKPEGVEIEFSASIGGDFNLAVLKGHTEGEFKVTLKWGKD